MKVNVLIDNNTLQP